MSNKILETQEKLKELGYFCSEELAKKILLFKSAGEKNLKNIPTLLLQGKSGAGKTFLAETFAELIGSEYDECFIQCFPRMGAENFQLDINAEGFIRQDADNLIKKGVLLKAIEISHKGPVLLTIDELDKARPEVDSFLLDFAENGRLSTGTEVFRKGEFPLYIIITSNDKREIDDALINRCRKVEVPRPEKELFLEILKLPQDHYLGWIYDQCPDFSIRQAKQYLEDLKELDVEFDEDALSQYINLDDIEVRTLSDIQQVAKLEEGTLEFEIPELETCQINLSAINSDVVPIWVDLLKNSGENFDIISRESNSYGSNEENIYVNVKSVKQLETLKKYGLTGLNYSGWFEYDLLDEQNDPNSIIWAQNKSEKNGTRFGLKVEDDKMFKIAMNRGSTFVYLDSNNGRTLEGFLGLPEEINEEYETDSEYDNDRDYYDDDDQYDYD